MSTEETSTEQHPEFDALDCWLHERIVPGPWELISEAERAALAGMARRQLGFDTLDTRNRDRLDFREVSVWGLREALARAFLAGRGLHPSDFDDPSL